MTGTQTPVISGSKLTQKNLKLREDLEHRLNRWFQETANRIREAMKAKYRLNSTKARKADDQDVEGDDLQTELLVGGKKIPKIQSDLIRALALLGWKAIDWEALVAIMQPYLDSAGKEGVAVGVGQVQMTDVPKRQQAAEEEAEQYADRRAAELAGMQRDADGNLEVDETAHWPLTDVMRRDLENSITQAVTEGWTAEQLAAVIEASYSLSAERATIIADTELTNAQSGGTYSMWKHSGTVTLVRWRVSASHVHEDECDDAEDQGVVPLGHEFAEGIFSPRMHPFCLCYLEVVE
jgi:hypothetical protein